MSETIDNVRNAAGAAGKSNLGEILFWSIVVGTPGVRRDELMTAMHSAGLDPDLVPDVVKPLTAANRAVTRACKDHGATYQVITDDAGRKIWAIVDPEINKGAQLGDSAGTLQNRVGYVKDQASLIVEEDTELGRQAVDLFRTWTEYLNGDDIRTLVHHYLSTWGAVRMIGSGGAYYIKPRLANEVAAFCQVINGLGDSEAFTVVLREGQANQQAVGIAARQQIAGEVLRLKDEVAAWKESPPRASTLERRIERYSHLKTELGDFADILKLQAGDLLVELDTLRTECALLLGAGDPVEDEASVTTTDELLELATAADLEIFNRKREGLNLPRCTLEEARALSGRPPGDTTTPEDAPLIPEAFTDPATGKEYATVELLQEALTSRTADPTPPARPGTPDEELPNGLAALRKMARMKGIAVKGLDKAALAAAIEARNKANA